MGCYVGIDALMRERIAAELFWKSIGARVDKRLHNLNRPPRTHKEELTFDKAVEAFVGHPDRAELISFVLALKVPELA